MIYELQISFTKPDVIYKTLRFGQERDTDTNDKLALTFAEALLCLQLNPDMQIQRRNALIDDPDTNVYYRIIDGKVRRCNALGKPTKFSGMRKIDLSEKNCYVISYVISIDRLNECNQG